MEGRSLCVPGQPDLHSKTLFGKKKKNYDQNKKKKHKQQKVQNYRHVPTISSSLGFPYVFIFSSFETLSYSL